MMNLVLFCFFVAPLCAQNTFLYTADPMAQADQALSERLQDMSDKIQDVSENKALSPQRSFVYSLAIPGLGQYLNNDKTRAYVYLGIEITAWVLYANYLDNGDEQTKTVENYVNNSSTGFDRIRFYRNLYQAEHPLDNLPAELANGVNDNSSTYLALKNNQALYSEVRALEKSLGDGVHSLPATKTQQYYEMVGKYYMFYHGWKHSSMNGIQVGDTKSGNTTPKHILNYYDERDKMNLAYKKATWAITAVIANHVISSIEAFISAKRRLKVTASSASYNAEIIQTLRVSYDF
jgi:hypothetical protein